eukprot:Sspe_Gene.56469::Locus_31067_Transcript_1_1_Confidence_1.000_Length_2512::g.56469::m.56469
MYTPRWIYLSGMGAVYLLVFTSYYVQYPGLFGADGLEPVNRFLAHRVKPHFGIKDETTWEGAHEGISKFPTLLWCAAPLGIDGDVFMEGLALIGMALGVVTLSGVHHGLLFAAMFAIHLSMFNVSTTMLKFQWDILLLESGFVTMLYAPWVGFRSSPPCPPVRWLVRFVAFKLFLMTASVKVQANCPTWKQLTALEYHYASTCIPTPASWYMVQLPPDIHRISVAVVFVCQLAAVWYLIAPFEQFRRISTLLQWLCMFLIQLTGNYNWFNMHTALLCLACWASDAYAMEDPPSCPSSQHPKAGNNLIALAPLAAAAASGWVLGWDWVATPLLLYYALAAAGVTGLLERRVAWIMWGVGIGGLAWGTWQMYTVSWQSPRPEVVETSKGSIFLSLYANVEGLRIQNNLTPQLLDKMLSWALPRIAQYMVGVLAVAGVRHVIEMTSSSRGLLRVIGFLRAATVAVLSLVVFGVLWMPFDSIHQGASGMLQPQALHDTTEKAQSLLRNLQISHSYGLFRRMTGVGRAPKGKNKYSADYGWGGLPPQVVAVPVLVLEGSAKGRNGPWVEIEMRYKPGHVTRPPPFVAPHQPRLDWQMWFAALGGIQTDPWVIHLAVKLMKGKADVLDLVGLDVDGWEYPFKASPPKAIRGTLYHYDFTRLDLPWHRRLPIPHSNTSEWWTRTRVREWLPPITAADADQFLTRNGLPGEAAQGALTMKNRNVCTRKLDTLCRAILFVRRIAVPVRRNDSVLSLMALLFLAGCLLHVAWRGLSRVRLPRKKEKLD